MKPETLHRNCRFFIVLIASIVLFFFGGTASGQTIVYVDIDATGSNNGTSWPNAYTDLQDALDFARLNEVDEIWVAEGTYTPTTGYCVPFDEPDCESHISFDLVDEVALYGGFDGTETDLEDRYWWSNITILSGDRLGNDGSNFTNRNDNSYHVITADDLGPLTIVDGFTIKGGYDTLDGGGGAYLTGTDLETLGPRFENCTFIDNYSSSGGGAIYAEDSKLNLRKCIVKENKATNGGGIMADSAILRHCTIQDNFADDPAVAQIHIIGECALVDCTIGESARAGGTPKVHHAATPLAPPFLSRPCGGEILIPAITTRPRPPRNSRRL